MCTHVCLCEYVYLSTHRGQRGHWTLALELQVVAEPPGMLGTELRPYARAVLDFNLCPISAAPKLLFMHAAYVSVCTCSCKSSSIWKPEGALGFILCLL